VNTKDKLASLLSLVNSGGLTEGSKGGQGLDIDKMSRELTKKVEQLANWYPNLHLNLTVNINISDAFKSMAIVNSMNTSKTETTNNVDVKMIKDSNNTTRTDLFLAKDSFNDLHRSFEFQDKRLTLINDNKRISNTLDISKKNTYLFFQSAVNQLMDSDKKQALFKLLENKKKEEEEEE